MHNEADNRNLLRENKESLRACQNDIFEVAQELLEENYYLRRRIKHLTNTRSNL